MSCETLKEQVDSARYHLAKLIEIVRDLKANPDVAYCNLSVSRRFRSDKDIADLTSFGDRLRFQVGVRVCPI